MEKKAKENLVKGIREIVGHVGNLLITMSVIATIFNVFTDVRVFTKDSNVKIMIIGLILALVSYFSENAGEKVTETLIELCFVLSHLALVWYAWKCKTLLEFKEETLLKFFFAFLVAGLLSKSIIEWCYISTLKQIITMTLYKLVDGVMSTIVISMICIWMFNADLHMLTIGMIVGFVITVFILWCLLGENGKGFFSKFGGYLVSIPQRVLIWLLVFAFADKVTFAPAIVVGMIYVVLIVINDENIIKSLRGY